MAVDGEQSIEDEAKALRKATTKGRRLLLWAFFGHLLILVVLVGLPYLRGRLRANEGKRELAAYAACLLGGDAVAHPGLALPDSAPEHYADEAHRGEILACQFLLEAIAPEEAFWLFPSTRHAENEVRRAVTMATGELKATASAATDQTPERPWLALQRVIAALTLWMEAADVQGNIFEPCVSFTSEPRSVRPERIPLQAAGNAVLDMRTHADGIAVVALDERGVSWVRVAAGALEPRRYRRPALVRDVRFHAGEPWVIWATLDARCAPRCAQRTIGVARLDDSDIETPEPVFLRAHPAGTVGQSVRISEAFVWIAARREDGVELVRFERSRLEAPLDTHEAEGNDDDATGPLAGKSFGVRSLRTLHLVEGSAEGLWGIDFDGHLRDGTGSVRADEAEWLLPAGESVFAGTTEAVVHVRGASSERVEMPPLTNIQATFEDGRAAVGGIAGDTLHVVRCGTECEAISIVGAAFFQLAFLEDSLVIAHSTGGEVRVQTWSQNDLSAAMIPAACWSENGGLCTPMVMTSRNGRVVLGGRDAQDLVVVETQDGVHWRRMVGLR